ncbi:MAG: trigger factor [Oscillospiraceae bacterium]|nr:trigger factor [Oscillospiraceae bacterium]
MTITSNNKTEINTLEVEFTINAEDFDKACTAAFMKARKNIAIPGFRKGKATRKMVETTYGEGAFYEDAVNDLYRVHIPKVIDEIGVEIVDAPEVEVADLSRENGVKFKVKLTTKPEVTVGEYRGLEVEVETPKVSDSDVDKELDKIRADNARIIDASDRAVQNGDIIRFDFAGFCEDEAFEGGTATDFELEIGSKRFIPGFEEQIIGKNVGEDFDVNVDFPDDYPSEAVRGKPAIFKCTVNEIMAKETAELDDEFVKDISEFDTLAEFREDVRERLNEEFADIRDVNLENAVAEKVVELTEAEIPEAMFENRIDDMAREWAIKYNMNPEDFARSTGTTMEAYREGFREVAVKQVRFRLALEKIAEIEKFEISEEEIEAEYKKMSENNRMTIEKVKLLVTEDAVAEDLKTGKALDLIKETAKAKDIEPKNSPLDDEEDE